MPGGRVTIDDSTNGCDVTTVEVDELVSARRDLIQELSRRRETEPGGEYVVTFGEHKRREQQIIVGLAKWSRPEVVRGYAGNQLVADKAEEESCSGATADDDNVVRRHLSPADPGRTSGRDH